MFTLDLFKFLEVFLIFDETFNFLSGAVPLPRQQRLADAVRGLLKSKREADEKVRKVNTFIPKKSFGTEEV